MKRASLFGRTVGLALALAMLTIGGVAMAQIFEKRPGALSTAVDLDPAHPAVFRVVINGQQLANRRRKSLNDTGSTPYQGWLDRDLEVELTWIESFDRQSYSATVTLPVGDLSRYDEAGDQAGLRLRIERDGGLTVATPHPEQLVHLRNRTEDQITPEMDRPVVLRQICADPLDSSDPRHAEMIAWLDDSAMQQATKFRDGAIARGVDIDAPGRCSERT